jgi:hypothetical protein
LLGIEKKEPAAPLEKQEDVAGPKKRGRYYRNFKPLGVQISSKSPSMVAEADEYLRKISAQRELVQFL